MVEVAEHTFHGASAILPALVGKKEAKEIWPGVPLDTVISLGK